MLLYLTEYLAQFESGFWDEAGVNFDTALGLAREPNTLISAATLKYYEGNFVEAVRRAGDGYEARSWPPDDTSAR